MAAVDREGPQERPSIAIKWQARSNHSRGSVLRPLAILLATEMVCIAQCSNAISGDGEKRISDPRSPGITWSPATQESGPVE